MKRPQRRGISLTEVVLGAMILGVSGVTVLELIRANTSNLQITEVEAVARGLAADVLERYARPSIHDVPTLTRASRGAQGVPRPWKDLVLEDPALRYRLPTDDVSKILDQFDVRIGVEIKANRHASFGPGPALRQVVVTAKWLDPGRPGSAGDYRTAVYASLVD